MISDEDRELLKHIYFVQHYHNFYYSNKEDFGITEEPTEYFSIAFRRRGMLTLEMVEYERFGDFYGRPLMSLEDLAKKYTPREIAFGRTMYQLAGEIHLSRCKRVPDKRKKKKYDCSKYPIWSKETLEKVERLCDED